MSPYSKHKRFLATTVVAAALLFSQGGSFLVVALCPHMQSAMASCTSQQSAEPASSHADMGHMGHTQMEQQTESQPNTDTAALGQPIGECLHCAVHSGTTPRSASLQQTEVSRRSLDLGIPLHVPKVVPVGFSTVPVLTSRAHGPPGEATPRHILIKIFRI